MYKPRFIVPISALAILLSCQSSFASVFLVDNFTQGSAQISSSGALVTDYQTDLAGVLGGTRYAYVQRTAGSGSASLGVNVFPFLTQGFFISSANAIGIGGLSWGRFEDLNANMDRSGLIFGFQVGDFAADEPGLSGTIRLTIYSDTGTDAVAKSISTFVNNPSWRHEEFDNSVNFANVTRIDLDWYGFSEVGADLEFSSFDTLNFLPEPGTMSMLVLALGVIMMARRRTLMTPAPVVASRSQGASAMRSPMPSASDLYSLPNRPF